MRKDQHNVGTPAKLRGQQTGFAGHPDQNREEMDETPSIRGNRVVGNKLAADSSAQHISSDSVTPSSNTPSTPAMNTAPKNSGGGEGVFKRKLARKRRANS